MYIGWFIGLGIVAIGMLYLLFYGIKALITKNKNDEVVKICIGAVIVNVGNLIVQIFAILIRHST